jgi:hypothetical protein
VSPLRPVRFAQFPLDSLVGCEPADLHEVDSFLAAEATCLFDAFALTGADDSGITPILERVAQSVTSTISACGLTGEA